MSKDYSLNLQYYMDEQNFAHLIDKRKKDYLKNTIKVYGTELLEGEYRSEAVRLGIVNDESPDINNWGGYIKSVLSTIPKWLVFLLATSEVLNAVYASPTGQSTIDNENNTGIAKTMKNSLAVWQQDFIVDSSNSITKPSNVEENNTEDDMLELLSQKCILNFYRIPTEVLTACNKAIKLDPKNAVLYDRKGIVLFDMSSYEDALIAFNKAIELDPENGGLYKNKGITLFQLNNRSKAMIAFNKSIELDPKNSSAYQLKGIVLLLSDNLKDALIAFNKSIELDPSSSAYINKGLILKKMGNFDESMIAFNKSIELNPVNQVVLYGYNSVMIELNSLEPDPSYGTISSNSRQTLSELFSTTTPTAVEPFSTFLIKENSTSTAVPIVQEQTASQGWWQLVSYIIASGFGILSTAASMLYIKNKYCNGSQEDSRAEEEMLDISNFLVPINNVKAEFIEVVDHTVKLVAEEGVSSVASV